MGWFGYIVVAIVGLFALSVANGISQWLVDNRTTKLLINEHISTLRLKYRSCVNEYGALDEKRWRREAKRFVDTVLVPGTSYAGDDLRSGLGLRAYEELLREVTEHASRAVHPSGNVDSDPDPTGAAFERRCAAALRDAGWDAHPTNVGADQGADVIARFDQMVLVLQCKDYTRPIGNKAVQEVIAAKAFYGATHAAVVGTAPFTEAAYQLANRANVALLDEAALRSYSPITA